MIEEEGSVGISSVEPFSFIFVQSTRLFH